MNLIKNKKQKQDEKIKILNVIKLIDDNNDTFNWMSQIIELPNQVWLNYYLMSRKSLKLNSREIILENKMFLVTRIVNSQDVVIYNKNSTKMNSSDIRKRIKQGKDFEISYKIVGNFSDFKRETILETCNFVLFFQFFEKDHTLNFK